MRAASDNSVVEIILTNLLSFRLGLELMDFQNQKHQGLHEHRVGSKRSDTYIRSTGLTLRPHLED